MLIFLGGRAVVLVWSAVREGGRGLAHAHTHGAAKHVHSGPPFHVHIGRLTLAQRPLLVGLVHGLAGSGAWLFYTFPSPRDPPRFSLPSSAWKKKNAAPTTHDLLRSVTHLTSVNSLQLTTTVLYY